MDVAPLSNFNLLVIKGNDAGSSTCFHELNGLKVIDIRTLGKELFIFFEESPFCLRIHFLMDGSVRYGDSKDRRHQVSDASLLIHFMDDKLAIFKSSVDIRLVLFVGQGHSQLPVELVLICDNVALLTGQQKTAPNTVIPLQTLIFALLSLTSKELSRELKRGQLN